MNNLFLYITVVLIWGSTFLGIKFQLGTVDPLISLIYRFGLAVLILLGWCRWKNLSLKIPGKHHLYFFYQGSCLFALNYWLVYLAEEHITSGIVAVSFTTIIFFNIVNSRVLLKRTVEPRVVWGALLGSLGIALIYYPEVSGMSFADAGWGSSTVTGLLFSLGAPLIASLGNIAATRNGQHNLPVIQTNAWSMAYGTLLMLLMATVMGKPFTMEWSAPYLISMGYLTLFGTVIAFGCYLMLLQRIGPERAAYSALLIPLVALILSTLFEGYQWTTIALAGTVMILGGNYVALKGSKS